MVDSSQLSKRQYGQRRIDLLSEVVRGPDGNRQIRSADLESILVQSRNLSLLMDVVRSIMTEMDLGTLLDRIMTDVTLVMNADRSTLFLLDAETNEIWSRVAQGGNEIRLPRGSGIAGEVIENGATLNIPDAYADPRFFQEYDKKSGYRTRTILCAPIHNPHAEIIGAIQVLNKKDGNSFTFEDEKLIAAFASLAGIALSNALSFETLERLVEARTAEVSAERDRSDKLLLNILPRDVAEELKTAGVVRPARHEHASILFTDFVGFTRVARTIPPEDLIQELDRIFLQFDMICERNGIEKLKTIGDAYMCVGGLPVASPSHAVDACLAALEIREFMDETRRIKQEITGEEFWQIRVGIHSGPVVAGVVGKSRFAYDIWGDSVNVASRMESGGAAGEINISRETRDLVDQFFECEYRGQIAIKNRGEVEMYFLRRIRPELSRSGDGRVPSEAFWELRRQLGSAG